jgi:hypothetical protein
VAEQELTDWSELSLTDLFFAYRKAKVDCFYESSIRVAEQFIEYEQTLPEKLTALLVRLQTGEAAAILANGIKQPIIFPKRLHFTPDEQAPDKQGADASMTHAFFSDAERAFSRATSKQRLIPEFRLIGDFDVETHILSALWVNLVGHKFDSCLSSTALASRVRRYRADKDRKWTGDYHREALGSFEPYFEPYRKWRDDGIQAMRDAINREQPIIAMTLDVGNFYHSIEPGFFVDSRFLEYLGVALSPFELEFSQLISATLGEWSLRCRERLLEMGCSSDAVHHGGIPIGLSVVRVVSNVLLAFLDRQVERQLSPIYYARYVDDLFLVLHDSGDIRSPAELWDFIIKRVPAFAREPNGNITLMLPEWGGGTRLTLQAAKQKTFFLSGRSGADLLDHIASQIREVSSERRTMPLPESIEKSQATRALAATDSADEADSLRRADGLTLRRLGWSVLLRAVNTLARDLRPQDWKLQRDDFYEFAHEHVIRADKVLEQIDHLPRLLSLAVSLGDWSPARRIYRETVAAIFQLEAATRSSQVRINGMEVSAVPFKIWDDTRSQVQRFFREALIRAYPASSTPPQARAFLGLLKDVELTPKQLERVARQAREADWARTPYREYLRTDAIGQPTEQPNEALLAQRYQHIDCLRQFLERTERATNQPPPHRVAPQAAAAIDDAAPRSILPFLFPTRPYTPEEIALYLPNECVFDEPVAAAHAWANYTRAVRGVWVRGDLAGELEPKPDAGTDRDGRGDPPASANLAVNYDRSLPVIVKRSAPDRAVRLALTSFEVTDESWERGAAGEPDLSPQRYWRLAHIVNAAIAAKPKPDYLLLPELSVPERWIDTIAGRLRASGISLIAGLDYAHHSNKRIDSSAVLVLTDDRLGYASSIQVRQRKSLPAPGEEEHLYASHGLSWTEGIDFKRVYQHNGLYFGILVCSELQNMQYRADFQGKVDCLIILSWNRDLESFSALVDAAALDVHAYVALVNNRRYGDSRLRRPAKQSFNRDVCRVRGGLNDQLVVVEISPGNLRRQQSRTKHWPRPTDAYKPAPEGFVISPERKCIPD